MTDFSSIEKTILVQYGIKKYENEEIVVEKLKTIMSEKYIVLILIYCLYGNCFVSILLGQGQSWLGSIVELLK